MNDNESQQLKPVYIHEAFATHDDEISLVDLALVLVRRKTIILAILSLFIVAGIALALTSEKKYDYRSSIEIGAQMIDGNMKSIEPPSSLLAKVDYSFIPKTLYQYQQQNPEDEKAYEITASNPKGSSVITLNMSATEDQSELVHGFIKSITQDILLEHDELFNTIKETLELQLTQATNRLNSMSNSTENLAEKNSLQDKIDSYLSQLANLRATKIISQPMKSQKPSGTSRKLIVVVAAFAGLFIGIFAAFFVEFAGKVREKKAELNLS